MANTHSGINPHVAADYLRQALLNPQSNTSRKHSEDDTHDQIGSVSATPSGVATPRPDPSDKRHPGILHSYFGQVGARFFTPPSSRNSFSFPRFSPDMENSNHTLGPSEGVAYGAVPTAPSSPLEAGATRYQSPPLLAPCTQGKTLAPDYRLDQVGGRPYPTPPASSPSSSRRGTSEAGSERSTQNRDPDTQNAGRPSLARQHSGHTVLPLRTRRQSGGLNPLSSITMSSPVHAAHISNPTLSRPSTRSNSPTPTTPAKNALSSLSSHLELVKLTDDVASPRDKNTPPLTPRALSNDGSEPARQTQRAPDSLNNKPTHNGTAQPTPHSSPPVGPPKGKLSVMVSEARGLRPSCNPYAVTVFEWIESVAPPSKPGPLDSELDSRGPEQLMNGVPIKRSGSDMGRSMAIPLKSRQSSTTSLSDQKDFKNGRLVTEPRWDHVALFDVLGKQSEVSVYIYDAGNQEAFLGHVKVEPDVFHETNKVEGWYKLEARDPEEDQVSGEVHLEFSFQKTDKRHYGPEDFRILKLIGKGTFGQVYQVRKKDTQRIYAMKVLSKKVIVQKKEVAHTLGERNILVRTATANSPFIVGLKFSFQTPTDLYLVTGFMSGGELFWHLQKEGRFNEGRAKFYIAELILALQHLHKYDIVYRDLKPENILLDANGHIALCDFGLSKANLTKDQTTNTFCGTTEYLAPEVLLDEQGYTTMVDFWSLGVLVFEMCCGWSPFYADETQQMYKNIAFGKVRFPKDALSTEGRSFVKGLLNRNPKHRLGAKRDADELKEHAFFADTDWNAMMNKMVVPPFKPKLKNVLDTSNFDPEFTNALQNSTSLNERAAALAGGVAPASTPLSPGMQANFKGFTFVDESTMDEQFKGQDLETMDEDMEDQGEDDDWEHVPEGKRNRDDRMSGIIRTQTNDEGIFNNQFDI
ncbi:Serine/threonine-protein kinase [Lecanora helva]